MPARKNGFRKVGFSMAKRQKCDKRWSKKGVYSIGSLKVQNLEILLKTPI